MQTHHNTDREIPTATQTARCRCPTAAAACGERPASPTSGPVGAIDTERLPVILERVEAALNALAQRVSALELISESAFERLSRVRSEEHAEVARQLVVDPLLVELCKMLLECRTPNEAAASDFELRLGGLLTRHGVSSFRPKRGDIFDPLCHSHGDSDFKSVHTRDQARRVDKVRVEGFQRGERVLIPARVIVTKCDVCAHAL